MPELLTIKRPDDRALDYLRLLLIAAPPLLLGYLWYRGRPLHFDDPMLNGAAHAAVVVLGILGGISFGSRELPTETRVERLIYSGPRWRGIGGIWWMFLPLLSSMAVGLAIFADVVARHVHDYGSLSVPPSRAMVVWATAFALSALFMALVYERTELRMSEEGLRWGLTQFAEWTNIHHFAQRRTRIEIVHRAQPDLPIANVPSEAWAVVEPELIRHSIPRDDSVSPLLRRMKRLSLLLFVLIAGIGIAAYFSGVAGPLSTTAGALVVSFAGAWFIERFRRLHRMTRAKYRRGSRRQDVRDDAPPAPSNDMPALANDAARVARDTYQLRLDFTPESVQHVETILTRLSDPHAPELTDFSMNAESMRWGAYVGEVARRVSPADWVSGAQQPPWLRHADGAMTFPVSWCYKRLKDGPDDNVWVKFQMLTTFRDRITRAGQT